MQAALAPPADACYSRQPMNGVKIVGIAGGSGSGKTTIVNRITEIVTEYALVAQDNYYRSAEYITNHTITGFNFDHPDAFDSDLLFEQLSALKAGGRSACRSTTSCTTAGAPRPCSSSPGAW